MSDNALNETLGNLERTAPKDGEVVSSEVKDEDTVLKELESDVKDKDNTLDVSFFDTTEDKQENEQSTESSKDSDTSSNEPDDAYDKAFAALIRDGWSSRDLKGMERDTLVRMGEKRSKVQEDTDKAYADLRGLKSQLANKGKDEADADQAKPESPLPKELVDRLTASLGERAAEDLIELARASVRPVEEKLNAAESGLHSVTESEMNRELSRVRSELEKDLPQLKDDREWAAFREDSRDLAHAPRYKDSSIEDVMRDFAKINYGVLPTEVVERNVTDEARSNGQMTSVTRSDVNVNGMTPEQREDMALAAIEAGVPMSSIKRKLGL